MTDMKLAQFQIPGGNLNAPTGIPATLKGKLEDSGSSIINTGLNLLFISAVILAVVFIIISGIQWITSSGNPEKISSAKKKLLYSIVGLIVIATAFLIFNVVKSILLAGINLSIWA